MFISSDGLRASYLRPLGRGPETYLSLEIVITSLVARDWLIAQSVDECPYQFATLQWTIIRESNETAPVLTRKETQTARSKETHTHASSPFFSYRFSPRTK